MTDMQSEQTFEVTLRQALSRLYDPAFLRRSPLVTLLGLAQTPNVAEDLRHTLEDAIEALKPSGTTPNPRGQRYYQILFYRYVQQFSQRAVADQLGVCTRHLRREQAAAIEALAESLRVRSRLSERDLTGSNEGAVPNNGEEDVAREMSWLGDSLADQLTEVAPVLGEALELAKTLAHRYSVCLDLSLDDLPWVAIAPTVLKQVALNLLTSAIHSVAGGHVLLTARADRNEVVLHIAASADSLRPDEHLDWDQTVIAISQRLAGLFNGRLLVSKEIGTLRADLVLPSAEQILVLAIEDNADTLQLWQRYVQDSRFRLVGTKEPEKALALAVELQPRLIVLDVMMPGLDGWGLLAQLRHHPQTSTIPVLVCTVLPQRELALSLGASEFISKPVTYRAFRAALERQYAALLCEPEH